MTHTLYRGRERILPDAVIQSVVTENQERIRATRDVAQNFPQSREGKTFDEIFARELANANELPEFSQTNFVQHAFASALEWRTVALTSRLPGPYTDSEEGYQDSEIPNLYNQRRHVLPTHKPTG